MFKTAYKLVGLSLAFAQAACAGALAEPFTPPENDGPAWIEIKSRHVLLRSDLPAGDAREACVEFEQIYSMFEDIAFPYAEKPRVQTNIVLFRRPAEYEVIAPKNTAGFFRRLFVADDYFEPVAVFYGDITAATRLTFQHELTHRFIDFYFPRAPVWLNEGMADYYSTMQVEGGKAVLGRDLPNRFFIGGLTWTFESTPMWKAIAHVPIGAAPSVATLLGMDKVDFYAARDEPGSPSDEEQDRKRQTANYAGAWALVNLFLNGPDPYPRLFNEYLARLASSMDPDRAWREAFGAIDDKLEEDYKNWLAPKDRIVRATPYEVPSVDDVSERAMTPSDVHILWASIRPWSSDAQRARAREDLGAAIRLDPKNISARVAMAQLDDAEERPDEAERGLREALAIAPNDESANYALFRLLIRQIAQKGGGQGRWDRTDAMLPKILSIATSARVQNGAAWYLALRNRTDEGLPLALRAVRGNPSCWQCFDTLATLLAQKGAYAKATEAQSIAVSLVPEGLGATGPMARLRRYEKAAREMSAGARRPASASPASSAP